MSARDPDDDVEISGCSAQLRSYIADIEHGLARSKRLRDQAVTAAGDAIEARELAYRERDAAARELVAVLAERDAARARAAYLDSLVTVGVLGEVAAERARQDEEWGEQNHPSFWRATDYDAATEHEAKRRCDERAKMGQLAYADILIEEHHEVLGTNKATFRAHSDNDVETRPELVQVAAVAVAWIQAIDRSAGEVTS